MATAKLPASAETIQEAADVKTTPAVAASETAKPMQVMSSMDSVVADLVKEAKPLSEIMSMGAHAFKAPNPLELPEECLAKQRVEYRYKWLNKDKELTGKLATSGWSLCNRTNSSYIKAYRFGVHGGVEKANMLLAFMPERLARELEVIPAQRSAALVKQAVERGKSSPKDAPIGFYTPEEGSDSDDES